MLGGGDEKIARLPLEVTVRTDREHLEVIHTTRCATQREEKYAINAKAL